ncbi:hypothetical protein [Plantactinospora endophytica]|uniref:Uncharacterized protein n=1 Tax=Plantactinospora endophytica TaxID=673535 RepID=A0ABQ4ECF1_9ACTN|nr:hypothetical protein [Plantactinospora endophytica]GIG91907.1 hypothetical protein Pen02_68430 [Plantactinospora endophytica]
MDRFLETALTVDVTGAATASADAAVNEASRQADLLLGGRPLPGSPEWTAEQEGPAGRQREVAAQLLHFRILLASGVDAFASVLGLRRWGVTWELIARAAGVSRQAAHERWGRRVLEVLDPYGTGELGGPVADDEADLRSKYGGSR